MHVCTVRKLMMSFTHTHIIKRVGVLRRENSTIARGYRLGAQAPSVAEHEWTVDKVHIQSDVGVLVLSKHL